MKILEPTGVSLPHPPAASSGAWTLDVRGRTVGFLWNGKPNADNLFRIVESRLKSEFGVDTIWVDKLAMAHGPALPATEEMFNVLTSGAIAVITGSGD